MTSSKLTHARRESRPKEVPLKHVRGTKAVIPVCSQRQARVNVSQNNTTEKGIALCSAAFPQTLIFSFSELDRLPVADLFSNKSQPLV
jgi:hypothetical protein